MASQKILVVSLGQFYHNDFIGREQSRDRLSHAHIDLINIPRSRRRKHGNTKSREHENNSWCARARLARSTDICSDDADKFRE